MKKTIRIRCQRPIVCSQNWSLHFDVKSSLSFGGKKLSKSAGMVSKVLLKILWFALITVWTNDNIKMSRWIIKCRFLEKDACYPLRFESCWLRAKCLLAQNNSHTVHDWSTSNTFQPLSLRLLFHCSSLCKKQTLEHVFFITWISYKRLGHEVKELLKSAAKQHIEQHIVWKIKLINK